MSGMIIDTETAHALSRHLMAIGFALAAISTFRIRRLGLSLFYLLAIAETYLQYRHPIHGWIKNSVLPRFSSVGVQREFQMFVTISALVIGLFCAVWVMRRVSRSGKPLVLVAFGTAIVLCMFAVEFISHHDIDAWIFAHDGLFVRACVIYAVGAVIAATGAELHRRRLKKRRRAAWLREQAQLERDERMYPDRSYRREQEDA